MDKGWQRYAYNTFEDLYISLLKSPNLENIVKLYSREPASHLRSTKIRYTVHALLSGPLKCFLWNPAARFPLLHTIHTKHQALAPSGPMLLELKFKFFRVEFSLRTSAKAWQEKSDGLRVQLLNRSNSGSSHSSLPSREFLQLLNQGMRDGWFWYAICFV